ncbi:MAG: AhpC/TSA family protein [Gammaproteobacteria bacterium]|nr:AhpC/TSA family protein [Gammaproteobacteria bacterium]
MTVTPRRVAVAAAIAGSLSGCIDTPPAAEPVDVRSFRSRIAADPSDVMPLLAGMPAPEFRVHQADGSVYTFAAGARKKPVIVTFYRGGWCPYCNRFLWDLREAEQILLDLGYELIFISADRTEKLAPFLEEKALSYALLSDNDLVAARAFGIAFRVTDDYFRRLLEHDIDIEDASGRTHHALPVPATFIIGTDGIIDFQYLNPDYKIRVHPDVLVAAARTSLEETDQ